MRKLHPFLLAIAGGVFLLLAAAAVWIWVTAPPESDPVTFPPSALDPATAETYQGFLYGRITTVDGDTHEGWLRWGGDEEAFWGHYFNGFKDENPWASHVAPEQLKKRRPLRVFGFEIAQRERQIDLRRPFMARFGDIRRIEADGRDLRVTLKSGSVFVLDRLSADDFADGVRVWDGKGGVVDLTERRMRTIEFLPLAGESDVLAPLHGSVHTRQGVFTGFIQWDREECIGFDELNGFTDEGEFSLRFDAIRTITRHSRDSAVVTLLDGIEIVLSDSRQVGHGNRGIYVDDRRYGRVLISWDAFERVDFSPGGNGPTYIDFPPGDPLMGSVTTRSGRRLTGRLVFDLDESETTETLDAPSQGVDYTVPLGLVESIMLPGPNQGGTTARVTLHNGEELQLERAGDLGDGNAGMLIFDDRERPEYVPWSDIEQVEFDRPQALFPPLDSRASGTLESL
jgi:hypothetical protein